MSLSLAIVMMLTMGMSAFAANTVPAEKINMAEVNSILEDIIEYSTFNSQTNSWELDHAIVEDGILTEAQYNDAESAGRYYEELSLNRQTRALPAALVLILKAIAALAGSSIVVEITQDIFTYGMTVACENFSDIDLFYDYCVANGYL